MPRRNRRRPAADPVQYTRLLADLRDAWAVRTGATWQEVNAARRAGVEPGTPAFAKFQKEHRRTRQERQASRPVSVDDARSVLAAYLT